MTNAELIKALRYCISDEYVKRGCCKCPINKDGMICGTQDDAIKYAADALEAAEKRIAELEARLPKEGEWRGLIIDGQYWAITCSNCHQVGFNARTPYCPNCGASMRR